MKKNNNKFFSLFLVLFFMVGLVLIVSVQSSTAQPNTSSELLIPELVIYYDETKVPTYVPAPRRTNRDDIAATATFNVVYNPSSCNGTTADWPTDAQDAFDFAASIWSALLDSSVPITVHACWVTDLPAGVLGTGGPNDARHDFSGAPVADTWYAIAHANAISGSDLNGTDHEIGVNFSSQFNWYFGIDGSTPPNQTDFATVVLHELGHGLGFLGSMAVNTMNNGVLQDQCNTGNVGDGCWGFGSGFPFIYDRFTQNGSGQSLIDTNLFGNPSSDLGNELTSNDLFFSGTDANAANGNSAVELYAPTSWVSGSSYSHLNDTTFSNTPNALMTSSVGPGTAIHSPGPITLAIFSDMEWGTSAGDPFEILQPLSSNPGFAGPFNNPSKVIIQTTKPIPGLMIDDFTVTIGGATGSIVTIYEGPDKYVLEVNPPPQSSNGLYELRISADLPTATVLDIESNAILHKDKNNVNVSLVIDRSGSMSFTEPNATSNYMEAAKQSATQFVDLMFDDDKLAVVSFDDIIETPHPMTLVDASSKITATNAISALDYRGLTSIGGGLEEGQNQLTTNGNQTDPWAIVLLTDGHENTSPMVADVLPAIAASKTVVHTIALGPSSDQDLLLNIASETGGTYNVAPTTGELQGIYNSISTALSGQQTLLSLTGSVQVGATDQKRVIVDSTIGEATFSINWGNSASTIDLTLEDPNGNTINPASATSNTDITYVSGDTYAYYRIKSPTLISGVWKMMISGGTIPLGTHSNVTLNSNESYTALVTGQVTGPAVTLNLYIDKASYDLGESIKVSVTLSDDQPITNTEVVAIIGSILSANSQSQTQNLTTNTNPILMLFDDGLHGDGQANDGVYANTLDGVNTANAGIYDFQVFTTGTNNDSEEFSRLVRYSVNVGLDNNSFSSNLPEFTQKIFLPIAVKP